MELEKIIDFHFKNSTEQYKPIKITAPSIGIFRLGVQHAEPEFVKSQCFSSLAKNLGVQLNPLKEGDERKLQFSF